MLAAVPPEKQDQFARDRLRDLAAAILLDPREREVESRRDAGRGVDVSVFNPDRIRFDSNFGVAVCQFAAEFPMSGGALTVQQAGFGQKKRAYANGSKAANRWGGVPHPRRQSRVPDQPRSDAANQQDRIDFSPHVSEPSLRQERKYAPLSFNNQPLRAGYDLDRIDFFSRQSVGGAENLYRTNKVEFFNRRHDNDDDSSLQQAAPLRAFFERSVRHFSGDYALRPAAPTSRTPGFRHESSGIWRKKPAENR